MREGNVVRIMGMRDDNDNRLLAIIEKIINDRAVLRYCYSDEPAQHNNSSEIIRICYLKDIKLVKE